jgi:ribosomal protein S12 methylthiotransferase accessory factor YcaO
MNAKLKLVIVRAMRTALQTASGLLASVAVTDLNLNVLQGVGITTAVAFVAALQNGLEQYLSGSTPSE